MTGRDVLKNFIGKDKKRLFLLAALVLGIMLLLFANWGAGEETEKEKNKVLQLAAEQNDGSANSGMTAQSDLLSGEEQRLASQLTEILQQIAGAGEVAVKVRLASSSSAEYAADSSSTHKQTDENDQAGGSRVITEESSDEQLVLGSESAEPWLLSQQAATIDGVIVVADGADNMAVKEALAYAVQAYCSLELEQIVVLPREKTEISTMKGGEK